MSACGTFSGQWQKEKVLSHQTCLLFPRPRVTQTPCLSKKIKVEGPWHIPTFGQIHQQVGGFKFLYYEICIHIISLFWLPYFFLDFLKLVRHSRLLTGNIPQYFPFAISKGVCYFSLLLLIWLTTKTIIKTVGLFLQLRKHFLALHNKRCSQWKVFRVGDDTVAASGCYVLLLRCHATQSGAGIASPPFPLLPGSRPDDPQDHETKALLSCPCACHISHLKMIK